MNKFPTQSAAFDQCVLFQTRQDELARPAGRGIDDSFGVGSLVYQFWYREAINCFISSNSDTFPFRLLECVVNKIIECVDEDPKRIRKI